MNIGSEMQEISSNNKRIAKNTLLLYFRMLVTMAVSLYTSRVVLNILGVEDFGIYNVVGRNRRHVRIHQRIHDLCDTAVPDL